MNVSVVVATFGDLSWEQLAHERAMPSAKAEDPYSLLSVHLPDGTLAEVRNLGAENASGDWLCFLDADDELAPGYLRAMERATTAYAASYLAAWTHPFLLVPAVQYVRDGTFEEPRVLNTGRPIHDLNHAVIGTLVPRSLFLEVGGFRELPALEDWDLWLRCVRAGAKLVDVSEAVYRVYCRENSRNADQRLARKIRAEHLAAIG